MHPCSVFLCCWISVKHSFEELLVSLFTCSNDIVTEQPTEKIESELCFFPMLFFGFWKVFCCSCFFSAAMEVAARFIALDRQDLPFVEYSWEFCRLAAALDVLARGQFPSSHGPPRHHRTKMEGRDPPVSGECPAPSQNQPAVIRGSPPLAVCGESQPTAVSGQHRVHSRARSGPGAHGVHSGARSVPGAHRAPPGVRASRAPPRLRAARAPPRTHSSYIPAG